MVLPDPVARRIASVYGGDGTLPATAGVLHVTAVWERDRDRDAPLVTLAINEHTPRSDSDFFALNLARARADAIVVTGKILRDEPGLRYELQGPMAPALTTWRRVVMGRVDPPTVVVLTSGRGFDPTHPALHGWARPLVFTTPTGADTIRTRDPAVAVVGVADPGLRAAVDYARSELGATTISIEAGPSSTADLYGSACWVDELMLSTYDGPTVPAAAQGPDFLSRARIESTLRSCGPATRPDGDRWRFERFVRRGTE